MKWWWNTWIWNLDQHLRSWVSSKSWRGRKWSNRIKISDHVHVSSNSPCPQTHFVSSSIHVSMSFTSSLCYQLWPCNRTDQNRLEQIRSDRVRIEVLVIESRKETKFLSKSSVVIILYENSMLYMLYNI